MWRSCRCPKFTQSDRKKRNTVTASLSTSLVRLFPHRAVTHSLWPCWPSRRPPCEHLFQTEWERAHPSAGSLRIFMTGWCHSGCSLAGIRLGSPRRRKTLMTHPVSWLEAVTEINRRREADWIPMSEQEVESGALKLSRCVMQEYRCSSVRPQHVSVLTQEVSESCDLCVLSVFVDLPG